MPQRRQLSASLHFAPSEGKAPVFLQWQPQGRQATRRFKLPSVWLRRRHVACCIRLGAHGTLSAQCCKTPASEPKHNETPARACAKRAREQKIIKTKRKCYLLHAEVLIPLRISASLPICNLPIQSLLLTD